jgi:hypothetical protein
MHPSQLPSFLSGEEEETDGRTGLLLTLTDGWRECPEWISSSYTPTGCDLSHSHTHPYPYGEPGSECKWEFLPGCIPAGRPAPEWMQMPT